MEDVTPMDSEVEAVPTPHGHVDGSPGQFVTRDVENMEDAYKPIVHSQSEHSVTAANGGGNANSNALVTYGQPTAQISTRQKSRVFQRPQRLSSREEEGLDGQEGRLQPPRAIDDDGDIVEEPRQRSRRAATSNRRLLWPNGVIPYEMGPAITIFVRIIRQNIMPDELYNFAKKKPEEINSLGDPYDYHSIMHYAKALFAKPWKSETIRPTDPKAIIGQVAKLSSSDVRQTNLLYDCPSCGQTLMQSYGTFSSPQVQTPLTGKSYESGRLQKSELNILIRPSAQHTFADSWQAQKTVSVASEAKASNRSLPANLPQVSSATPSSLICRWRIVAENHEKISLHFKHMEMPSPVNSHLSGKQQQTDGQPLTGVPQECTDEHIEVHDGYYGSSVLLGM
ncbi:Bone morphoproteintic protein 1 [Sparganum proliferum]